MVKFLKNLQIIIILAGSFSLSAVESPVNRGLLCGRLTIAPGYLTGPEESAIYLSGSSEYFLSSILSLRSDGFFYVGSGANTANLEYNHQGFLGIMFHMNKTKAFDPFVGFEPGFAIVKSQAPGTVGESAVSPVILLQAGFNYFAVDYFHFFASLQYTYGSYFHSKVQTLSLSEFRISTGLGFNVNL